MSLKRIIKLVQKLSSKNRSRHQSSTNPSVATPLNILEILPPELIIYLVQFLPLSSTALFTLSCRTIYTILGTRYWTYLRAKDQHDQHFDFLSQLSKELPPDYVPCYHCRVLHLCTVRYSNHSRLPPWPLYLYDGTPCNLAEVQGRVSKYLHANFQFRTFQMAMKRHRLRLNPEPWLEFLCFGPTRCRISTQQVPSEFRADVRIVNGSLLFRTTLVILIPLGLTLRDLSLTSFPICPHVCFRTHGAAANLNLPETAGCTMDHAHGLQRCVRKSDIALCIACPTEYELRLEECAGFGVAAIITKWMDLGEGQTIRDPRWWSHLGEKYTASDVFREVDSINGRRLIDRDPVRSTRASIRASFGNYRSSGYDSILPLRVAQKLSQLPKLPA